jgi:hypothetical protein
MNFLGDIRASWHPDENPDTDTGGERPGEVGSEGADQPSGQGGAAGDVSRGGGADDIPPEGSAPRSVRANFMSRSAAPDTARDTGVPQYQLRPGP